MKPVGEVTTNDAGTCYGKLYDVTLPNGTKLYTLDEIRSHVIGMLPGIATDSGCGFDGECVIELLEQRLQKLR